MEGAGGSRQSSTLAKALASPSQIINPGLQMPMKALGKPFNEKNRPTCKTYVVNLAHKQSKDTNISK